MEQRKDTVQEFEKLPRRVFLDTSILHLFSKYGEFLFENIEPPLWGSIFQMSCGFEELDYLRAIFFLNRRSAFEYAISDQSLSEVAAKGEKKYLQWVYEWVCYWNGYCENYETNPFEGKGVEKSKLLDNAMFGYLSKKDRLLIKDALLFECHAFLTTDFKLQKNWRHLDRHLGLLVLRPSDFWSLLRPWAGLFV